MGVQGLHWLFPSSTLPWLLVRLGRVGGVNVMINGFGALVSTPPFATPPWSCSCTVTVAAPIAPAAGVKVSAPVADTAGCAENSAVLVVVTMKFSVCPLSSAGPALMLVAQPATVFAPESCGTVWSAPLVKLGASFTAVTLMVNVCAALVSTPPFAVPPSSCSCTVTVADPFA